MKKTHMMSRYLFFFLIGILTLWKIEKNMDLKLEAAQCCWEGICACEEGPQCCPCASA